MQNITLFDAYNMKGLKLKNRIVMPALTRNRSDNPELAATELTAVYYRQRATAGLMVTEGTTISTEAVGYINVPGIYSNAQIRGWSLVTEAVHEEGSIIFAQLWHVGRVSHPVLLNGQLPLGPSALNPMTRVLTTNGMIDTLTCREMTTDDIKRTIQDFIKGAANSVKAGFDGVEIHAANGYLLHQFFNLYANHRTDEYGGSIENRARILFEILDGMKEVISLDRVGVRLNPSLHNALGMMIDEESTHVHEYIVRKLSQYGIAYIHLIEPMTNIDEVPFAVKEVTKHYRALFNSTVITNRRYTKETGSQMISYEQADLVSFGIPFIANPDLVKRFEKDLVLNTPDPTTFYTSGATGYTDYPYYGK